MGPKYVLAYQMAIDGLGWEDIQARLRMGVRKDQQVWEILTTVHASKAEAARRNTAKIIPLPSLKKEKGNHLHG